MARRRRHQVEESNRERWMVSYADFITLLFAFFVVMYSISSVNEGKYKVLSESMVGVFNSPQRSLVPLEVGEQVRPIVAEDNPIPGIEPLPATDSAAPAQETKEHFHQMSGQFGSRLADLISDGLVTINESEKWIELSLRNSLLFSSGDAIPNDEAFPLIDEVAAVLREYPNPVLVEGYTDNLPISNSIYPSNWELSSARAAAVVRLLVLNGIAADRLAAVGHGENQPVADNNTAEGRQRNRRVVLLIAKDESVRFGARPE